MRTLHYCLTYLNGFLDDGDNLDRFAAYLKTQNKLYTDADGARDANKILKALREAEEAEANCNDYPTNGKDDLP